MFGFELCPRCGKPLVNERNLYILRAIIVTTGILGGGAIGAMFLPLLGFGAAGVTSGSAAAAWQSSIGNVAAGSLFATLTSLGATGIGVLLFGAIGSVAGGTGALALLYQHADGFGFCTCPSVLDVPSIKESISDNNRSE